MTIGKMFILCASLALASSAIAQSDDSAPIADTTANVSPTALKLINGWYSSPYSTSKAEVEIVGGIVHFKGAIATSGTNTEAFVLPAAFRPTSMVYVPVDQLGATNGRLVIYPTGQVYLQAEFNSYYAEAFTSLDGASFALKSSPLKPITLINGWGGAPFETSKPEAALVNGIVHLKGAIDTSTSNLNNMPFILAKEFWPEHYVRVPVDLCNSTYGQLDISPSGEAFIETEGDFSNAQCFTSLDGVSYPLNESGFTSLKLLNGWTFDEPPAVKSSNGIVSFQGGIYTSGSSSEPFLLPSAFRPKTNVYVPVTLCNTAYGVAKGRLNISPNGVVTVQAEDAFSQAQCLTSLVGASFVK